MVDVSTFHLYNVTDTCSVWNVLSSAVLYAAAKRGRAEFICPLFVVYECLNKPRSSTSDADAELSERLQKAQASGAFQTYRLGIEDLQTISLLEQRKRLGKGELSAIALAQKIGQACLTDDQEARLLAESTLAAGKTQTTPHLVGWLFFERHLTDGDLNLIVVQHEAMDRPLAKYFKRIYDEACRCRLLAFQGQQYEEWHSTTNRARISVEAGFVGFGA